jgi:ribosome-associated heat shock protein Hsp15
MRIDKFLWCIRLYKTRSLATAACKAGKIVMNGDIVKPSLETKLGMEFQVKNGAMRNSFRILEFPSSRVSAKLVQEYILDITSPEDKKRNDLLLESKKENALYEFGKPSKKDRRDISRFKSDK